MIKNAFTSLGQSYSLILKDKGSLVLALIPIVIGLVLYYFLGMGIFNYIVGSGQGYIENYLGDGTIGTVVNWIIKVLLSILLYYIANLTFVLIVSVIASPFNDALSARIEKQVLEQELPDFGASMGSAFKKFFSTVFTEIRKVLMIVILSFVALLLSFFPLLAPVSILIGAMLLSIEYIDFSWSRHGLDFKTCKKEYRSHWISYSIGGFFFMMLISIPVLNLVVPSLGTSYFTTLWVKNNEHTSQITQ